MESSLEIGFLRVTEKAAIAAARTMGYGKRKYSDQVAVEAMREELNRLKMRGSIAVLAASEKGGLLNAPDVYMDKLVVGPTAAEYVDLQKSVQENLGQMA